MVRTWANVLQSIDPMIFTTPLPREKRRGISWVGHAILPRGGATQGDGYHDVFEFPELELPPRTGCSPKLLVEGLLRVAKTCA